MNILLVISLTLSSLPFIIKFLDLFEKIFLSISRIHSSSLLLILILNPVRCLEYQFRIEPLEKFNNISPDIS